jgi:hypothetical protein
MEPMHDELLGIEIQGTPRTAHSDPDAVQYDGGRWIMAEEVQPPSVWSTAFDPVEECAMTSLQQAVLKMLAMATHNEGLTCERTRSQPVQVLGRRIRHSRYPDVLTSWNPNRGKVGQYGGGEDQKVPHGAVFSRAPSKPCSKTIVRMVLVAIVALPRSVALGDWLGRLGGFGWQVARIIRLSAGGSRDHGLAGDRAKHARAPSDGFSAWPYTTATWCARRTGLSRAVEAAGPPLLHEKEAHYKRSRHHWVPA